MEKNWDSEVDKILSEGGVNDEGMTQDEKRKLAKTLRQSKKDFYGGSPLSNSQKGPYGGTPLSTSQEDDKSLTKEEKLSLLNDLKTGSALGEKVLDHNSCNLGNTSQPLKEKEVSEEFSLRRDVCSSAAVARSPSEKLDLTIRFKSSPRGPVAIRSYEQDPNSSYQANASPSNDGVWLTTNTNKENSTFSKRSTSTSSKEDAKSEETTSRETENTSPKDNVNTFRGESKDRESPENLKVPRLNALVFKNRTPSSFFLELASLPPLNSLSREEWVRTACENLFARKVAQMEKNCGLRWVTLSERSISIASLENAVAKASPQRSKDDGSSNFSDSIPIAKASSSPENIFNDVQEGSPDVVVVEDSPESHSVNSESAEIAPSESTKNQGKVETPVSSPAGRSDNHGNHGGGDGETGRRKSARNRGRKGRGGSRPNTSNDDISNGAPTKSVVGKDTDRDVVASTSNYSPIGGNSPADNNAEEQCPMCQRSFSVIGDLQIHAWKCMGATAEGENQVAENSGRSDVTEPKRKKIFSSEDDDEELQIVDKMNSVFNRKSDGEEGDDDFVTKTAKTYIRKRHLALSDDEDILSKSPRK